MCNHIQEITNQNGNNAFNNNGMQINVNYVTLNSKLQKDFNNQKFNFKIRKFSNFRILNKFNINEYFVMINRVSIISFLSFLLLACLKEIRDAQSFFLIVLSCTAYSFVYYNWKMKARIDIDGITLNKEFIKFSDIRQIGNKNRFFYQYLEFYFLNEIEPRFSIYPDNVYQSELIEDIFLNSINQKENN